jgi:hypothetical protein
MLSDEAKREIEALSQEELRQEINKKNKSRFQGEKYAYAQTWLEILEQKKQEKQRSQDVSLKQDELSLAQEANRLSRKANNLSKIAIFVAVIAALIALGGLILNVCSK